MAISNRWDNTADNCGDLDLLQTEPSHPRTTHRRNESSLRNAAHRADGLRTAPCFTLRNISEQAIHIRKISTTCGCTDAKTDTDDIAPGATLMVSAVLHLSAPGPKLANILLVTDQPEQEIVRLSLAAVAHQARQLLAVPSHLVVRPG
ncbi:MAG: DUF1573 domain-containing protein, partial [Planctomycetes bacterium]|nr:DUF1573 domain-containing protein [Planctomycetota bacterium]